MRLVHFLRRGMVQLLGVVLASLVIGISLLATSGDAVASSNSVKVSPISPVSPPGRMSTTTVLVASSVSGLTGFTLTATVTPAPGGVGALSIERCVDRAGLPAPYDACTTKRLPNGGRWVVAVSDAKTDGVLQAEFGAGYFNTGFRAVYRGGKGYESSDSDPANYP